MTLYYDDNFGAWSDMDDPDMVGFYYQCQATNVLKQCQGCGHWFKLQPSYGYCNGCADAREKGWETPEFIDHPRPEADPEAPDYYHGPAEEEEVPTPFEACAACLARAPEDCTCEDGPTNSSGEATWCFDCNRHFNDCNCYPDEGPAYGY
jgi:hypothetical protein